MRTAALIVLGTLLACGAQAGEVPEDWRTSHFIDPDRCVQWVAWGGKQIYRGQGGHPTKIDGMDVWVTGRPERSNRQLGYVIYYLPTGSRLKVKGQGTCPVADHDRDAVALAKRMGGDAVIPLGRLGNQMQFRVVQFLPENVAVTGPITDEHVGPDVDNTKMEREENTVVRVVRPVELAYRPDLRAYWPKGLAPGSVSGIPVVTVCPDRDGTLSKPVVLAESSGTPALDEAALRWATDARYKPRPDSAYLGCSQLRVQFSGP